MSLKLADIVGFLEAELVSASDGLDPAKIEVSGVSDPSSARVGEISFVSSKAYVEAAKSTAATALIVSPDLVNAFSGCRIVVDNPYLAYALVTKLFAEPKPAPDVHESAVVAETALLGAGVYIAPNVTIMDDAVIGDHAIIGAGSVVGARAKIGARSQLHPNVSIYYDVKMGVDCIVHSGAVIGSDGFGFAPSAKGYVKIHQLGTVIIGDDVEIGANASIDRGALGNTEIHRGVKIDNLVHIAHNCVIGEGSALAGQVGMAGSTTIGQNCSFAGQVGIAGHIEIGDHVHALGQAKLTKTIKEPGIYSSGTGFSDMKTWRKNAVRFNQLDELFRRVQSLEKQLNKKIEASDP